MERKKWRLNLELEIGKSDQRFYCETSINTPWFCFIGTKLWHLPLEGEQLCLQFSKRKFPSFLLLADAQLFKFFFHLIAFGNIPSIRCPKHATCKPWRFIGVYQDAFSGNSCLATLQSFCSWSMDQSHQASSSESCSFDCPSASFALPAATSSMPGTSSRPLSVWLLSHANGVLRYCKTGWEGSTPWLSHVGALSAGWHFLHTGTFFCYTKWHDYPGCALR